MQMLFAELCEMFQHVILLNELKMLLLMENRSLRRGQATAQEMSTQKILSRNYT